MRRRSAAIPQKQVATGADCALELQLLANGERCVCGVDEAGRGPLAGPVVAAAVIFVDCESVRLARDSKSMSAKRRNLLCLRLQAELACGVGIASVAEIEQHNILQATMLAMQRAIAAMPAKPTVVLIDGNRSPELSMPAKCIVGGDRIVATISAASIIAKVTRDRIMANYHSQFPEYGFDRNAGYPTAFHRRALLQFGPCPIHRRTFHVVCPTA